MDIPTAQEKSEQIFFAQPKVHQNKFADLNKMVPAIRLRMIAFFEQCQATNKVAGILEKIAKDEQQPKEKIMVLIFLSRIAVNQATSSTVATNIAITFKVTDGIAMITGLIIIIKTIDAMIVVNAMTRMQGTASPTTRRMIASAITSRKRVMRPCTMTSPLHQAQTLFPVKGVAPIQVLLLALAPVLALAKQQWSELYQPSCCS